MVAWLDRAPSWLQVESVEADRVQAVSGDPDLGEREAIALAQVVHADLLLMLKADWKPAVCVFESQARWVC